MVALYYYLEIKKENKPSIERVKYTMDEIKSIFETENEENDKPPSCNPRPVRPLRVAVIANVKGEKKPLSTEGPADAGAEFDKLETIQAIQTAIESDGHSTIFVPADVNLAYTLRDIVPDICFNISEGLGGDGREAQAPALFEMLHIPYTASRVLTSAVALDKTMTKRIWRDVGLPVAPFQEFTTGKEPLDRSLRFPLFVKPAREGTGMGMDMGAICHNSVELKRRIEWVVETYHEPALVEEYLPGREFTVGILGRKGCAEYSKNPGLYGKDGFHRFPVLEVDHTHSITPGVYGIDAKSLNYGETGIPEFICPAKISADLANQMTELAIRGHNAIGAVDVSRVDFRLDANGQPNLLEINTLPGLTPGFSDLCVLANGGGMSYQELILEILYLGASRYGLIERVAEREAQQIPVHSLREVQRHRVPERQPVTAFRQMRTMLR